MEGFVELVKSWPIMLLGGIVLMVTIIEVFWRD